MSISKRQALNLLHMFEQRGQTVTASKDLRVSLKIFARWLSAQDGSSEQETYETLRTALKAA